MKRMVLRGWFDPKFFRFDYLNSQFRVTAPRLPSAFCNKLSEFINLSIG